MRVPSALVQRRICGSIIPSTSPHTRGPAPQTPLPRTRRGPRRGSLCPSTTRAPCPRPVSPHPPPSPRCATPGSPLREQVTVLLDRLPGVEADADVQRFALALSEGALKGDGALD